MNILQQIGRFMGEKIALVYGILKLHIDDNGIHRTSEEIRGEITEADIPAEIARVEALNAGLDGKVDKVAGRELMPSPGSVPSGLRFLNETGTYTEVEDGCVVLDAVMISDTEFTVDEGQLNEYYERCIAGGKAGTELFFRFVTETGDVYCKVVLRQKDRDVYELKAADVSRLTDQKGGAAEYRCSFTVDREADKAVFTGGTIDSYPFYVCDYIDAQVGEKANAADLEAHRFNLDNPHRVSKSQVGLSEVNNTSDADKPVSTATQAALTAHNESGEAHPDLRNGLENLTNGAVTAKNAEYAEKLGSEADSYTKAGIDTVLNKLVKELTLNDENFVLTVTYRDGTVKEIDFPIESTVKDGRFDVETNELVLMLVSGQEIRIPATGLAKVYTGKEGVTATVDINAAGEIRAEVKQGAVKKVHLNAEVLDEIASHQTRTGDAKDNVVTFPDQAVRENVASGDKFSVLFGKLKKWLGDLGTLAFKSSVSKGDLDLALQTELNDKAGLGHTHTKSQITDFPAKLPTPEALTFTGSITGMWDGSAAKTVNIPEGLSLGETSAMAYRGDRGKVAYDYSQGTRTIADVSGLQNMLDSKANASSLLNYLPVSGGTITSESVEPFILNSTGGACYQSFKKLGVAKGYIGLGSSSDDSIQLVAHNGDVVLGTAVGKKALYNSNEIATVNQIPTAETASTIMSKINSQGEIVFSKHVVCSGGAGTASTSDMRYKKNVRELRDMLPLVKKAPLFNYTWKEEEENLIGTSAQYWEQYLPELVYEMADGTKTLSYERLGGVVALKALQEECAQRVKENEELRYRLEVLEKVVTELIK